MLIETGSLNPYQEQLISRHDNQATRTQVELKVEEKGGEKKKVLMVMIVTIIMPKKDNNKFSL